MTKFDDVDVISKSYGGKSIALVLRNISMRDFFMPFYLCFTYDKDGGPFIWEDINEPDYKISTLNGSYNDNLQSLTFSSIDKNLVDKQWKNAVFLEANNETSGANCIIVFFDWFYRFFLKAFLNSTIGLVNTQKVNYVHKTNVSFVSNVIPDFYFFSLLNGVGYAKKEEDTFNNLFDEMNAYTVALRSQDTTNEALREMGKNLASFVLSNDTYTFNLKGSMLRRPNEIIRLNIGNLIKDGTENQLNVFTNLNSDSGLFVYVRKVTHKFAGDEYVNTLECSKICETL